MNLHSFKGMAHPAPLVFIFDFFLPTSVHNTELSLNCFHQELKTFCFDRDYLCDQVHLSSAIAKHEHQIFNLN